MQHSDPNLSRATHEVFDIVAVCQSQGIDPNEILKLVQLLGRFATRAEIEMNVRRRSPRFRKVRKLLSNFMDEDREDPAEFQVALSSMTDDEVFLAMQRFERASGRDADPAYALAMIGLVETEIERRFPGQALAPYKVWQRSLI